MNNSDGTPFDILSAVREFVLGEDEAKPALPMPPDAIPAGCPPDVADKRAEAHSIIHLVGLAPQAFRNPMTGQPARVGYMVRATLPRPDDGPVADTRPYGPFWTFVHTHDPEKRYDVPVVILGPFETFEAGEAAGEMEWGYTAAARDEWRAAQKGDKE